MMNSGRQDFAVGEVRQFYDPIGLRNIALLIDSHLERENISQNELASFAGIAPGTIGNLRHHRNNEPGRMLGKKPDPDTIMAIAPLLINPATGKAFEPWDLILLATGRATDKSGKKSAAFADAVSDGLVDSKNSHQVDASRLKQMTITKGVKVLRKAMGKRTAAEVAILCQIEPSRLDQLLAGEVMPDASDIGALALLFPDQDPSPLWRAYREP